jgi:hypothetical protein
MSEVAGLHLRYAAIVRPGYQLVKQEPCPTRLLAHLTSLEHPSTNHAKTAGSVSVSIENHAAMVAIHAVYYNFGRIHKTLRITPAMAAGLSDHVWSLEEIVLLAH